MNKTEIKDTIREVMDEYTETLESERRTNRLFEWAKVALMPLVITLISILASLYLNQQKSALLKAQAEQQSKQTTAIAALAKDTIDDIFQRQHETQYLSQIKDIYLEIVNSDRPSDQEQLFNKIKSLEAYKTTALPFLINLSQYYNVLDKEGIGTKIDNTINSILRGSQADISKISQKTFKSSDPENKLMMRFANFENYNMNNITFEFCNLYSANFSRSLLTGAKFISSDLYQSDFAYSNLRNTKFIESNLKNANFKGAELKNAKFINCQLDGAHFPYKYLKYQMEYNPAFSTLDSRIKRTLLSRHVEKIKSLKSSDKFLSKLLQEFKMSHKDFVIHLMEYNVGAKKNQGGDKSAVVGFLKNN